MTQEREIKLILRISLAEFIKKIKQVGFRKEKLITQEDTYFDTKNWKLYKSIAALRLRRAHGKDDSFSFKKLYYFPRTKNKWFVEEIEVRFPLNDTKKLQQIFKRLGIGYKEQLFSNSNKLIEFMKKAEYQTEQHYKKNRTIYRNDSNQITIDDVEKVGVIVELECQKDDPYKIANELLNKQEWEASNEGLGNMWLHKVKGFNTHLKLQEQLKKNSMLNVWENEREMYEKLNNIK